MEKSHITLEQKMCIVCGKEYDTNALLLDRRLKPVFDMHTTTGYGLCKEHQEKADADYIALVECDPSKSMTSGDKMKTENAHRTGRLMHIRKTVFEKVFNTSVDGSMCFIDIETFEKIKAEYEGVTA